MRKLFIPMIMAALLLSCASNQTTKSNVSSNTSKSDKFSWNFTEISKDDSYGYDKKNPVKVGGVLESSGPTNERKYLNSLLGPQGQDLLFYRAGSCCAFKSKNSPFGSGLLDVYRVYWQGSKDTLTVYINMYDKAALKGLKGLNIKSEY